MKEIRLIMLGFGNAGKAFARLLNDKREEIADNYDCEIKVVAITTKSRGSLLNLNGIDILKAIKEIEDWGNFKNDDENYSEIASLDAVSSLDYDVMMELTPLNVLTGQPAKDHIMAALGRGKHVITANKGPVAWAYSELKKKAQEKGVQFLFETTVMDGSPVFNMVKDTLPLCKVTEIRGILNSTTNYILEEMEKGKDYSDIIEKGKRLGFIEADPAMDVEGWDATAKIATLMNVLMGANVTPLEIKREGIGEITYENIREAKANGKAIKLLCHAKYVNGHLEGSVGPEHISEKDIFANINGTTSVLSITTDLMKTVTIIEHDPDIEQTAYGPFVDLLRILKQG